jgi:ABC-type multidrug transport system fused ATPase/permease subunit
MKAAEQPVGQAGLSMSSLSFIQSATRNLASSIYRFVFDLQHFGDELSAFKSYYRVLEIKSAIKEPEDPRIYAALHRTVESEDTDGVKSSVERCGMEIEFIDVCYTWPGRKEKALDHISFKINAGELTAIVGYNGAGKS